MSGWSRTSAGRASGPTGRTGERVQTGTKISGLAHIGLILAALFGGAFSSEPPHVEVAEVSLISAEEFAALTAAPAVAPEAAPQPEPVPETPPEPAAVPEPEPEPEPATEPEPEPAPEPAVETPQPDPVPEPTPAPAPVVDAPRPEPEPAPTVDRVAPVPNPAPAPEVQADTETRPEVAQDTGAERQTERQEATAPPEATDQLRPEPPRETVAAVPSLAPAQSKRPPARRPEAPRSEPAPEAAPEPVAEPKPRDTAEAVNSALAAALGGAETEAPRPAGPPLSAGEKDALRVAVSQCWNVGSLSSAALATTVVVAVNMGQDGKPDTGSIRMLSSSGGDAGSARQAFEAARRAIIRCGARGFDLPAEKYAHWREVEMTFNPEGMRLR